MMSYSFYKERKEWSEIKHRLLGKYLVPYCYKLGSWNNEIFYIDGFAGKGKYEDGKFHDDLIQGCIEMIESWNPAPSPAWVTCIPSLTHRELVPDFARRLARRLGLPFVPAIKKCSENLSQKQMQNSCQQANNLDGVFEVESWEGIQSPVFLVDDMVDSRWTFTVVAALLRQAGCEAVLPLALALNTL